MKTILLFLICLMTIMTASGQYIFRTIFPNDSLAINSLRLWSAKQTNDGGYVACGDKNGSALMIKFNSVGDTVWTRTYGLDATGFGYYPSSARDVIQTSDGGLALTGHIQGMVGASQVFLVRTNSFGDTLWTKNFGFKTGPACTSQFYDWGNNIKQTEDGGFLIGGTTNSNDSINNQYDAYVLKTDINGNLLWANTFGKTGISGGLSTFAIPANDGGYAIAYCEMDSTLNSRILFIKTDSNGDTVWTKYYGLNNWLESSAIYATNDNGFIITGWSWTPSNNYSALVMKIDQNGIPIWTKIMDTPLDDGFGGSYHGDIADAGNNNIFIVGSTSGFSSDSTQKALIIKLNSITGDTVWCRTYGSTGIGLSWGPSIASCNDGGAIITSDYGYYSGSGSIFGAEIFKISSNGKMACGEGMAPINILDTMVSYVSETIVVAPLLLSYTSGVEITSGTRFETSCNGCDSIVPLPFFFSSNILTIAFSDTTFGATGWFWDFGDGNTSTVQNPIHTYSSSGNYIVCLTVSNDCSSAMFCDSLSLFPSLVTDINNNFSSNVIPNPFAEECVVHLNKSLTNNCKLLILDQLGQVVLVNSEISGNEIKISNLMSKGIYFYKVISDKNEQLTTGKIIKQ